MKPSAQADNTNLSLIVLNKLEETIAKSDRSKDRNLKFYKNGKIDFLAACQHWIKFREL